MAPFHLLCAGAAQGLVKALQDRFSADTGTVLQARFGAVGALKEALLAGEPCDVMVATDAMLESLAATGALRGPTRTPLGRVRTGIAVRSGQPRPDVASAAALKAALLAADAVFFPDPERATAGIHFANVLRELGVFATLSPRLRTFPNGATAMRELAASRSPNPIGCTQLTEIIDTPGVEPVGALPQRFELATVYSAAIGAHPGNAEAAARLIELLAGPASHALREAVGFEV
jgi:molybdate transport system substrate-binding protein